MADWRLTRKWRVISEDRKHQELATHELMDTRAFCLLGTAGMGKTHEMKRLAASLCEMGIVVLAHHLGSLATTADALEMRLQNLSRRMDDKSVLILDGLDEAMASVPTAGLIVATWIREELVTGKPRIAISCRSTVLPNELEEAFVEAYQTDMTTVVLTPLDEMDQRSVATQEQVDPTSFLLAVRNARAIALAQQPLTLKMLLSLYKSDGSIAQSRCELFSKGTAFLCQERRERRDLGTVTDIPLGDILSAAERLATYVILSGCEGVTFDDNAVAGCISWRELEMLPSTDQQISERMLKAIARTGLVEIDGSRQMRFAHRQLAEYLAGRRLAKLPLHQTRALLAKNSSWRDGVASPVREAAAFAGSLNDAIATWITTTDPEVIGLSDVAHDDLRRWAALAVIEKCRNHEITDDQILHEEVVLIGLAYRHASVDLRAFLAETADGLEDMYQCVIKMIVQWNLCDLDDSLVTFFLDSANPMESRKAAGYALTQIATAVAKSRIKDSLCELHDDSERELRGLALRCAWPEFLTTDELLSNLTPRGPTNYSGAYEGLLFDLERQGFAADGARLAGLQWARTQIRTLDSDLSHEFRIIQHIAHAALHELDRTEITSELLSLMIDCHEHGKKSPLSEIDHTYIHIHEPASEAAVPPLKQLRKVRRTILMLMSERLNEHQRMPEVAFQTPGLLDIDDAIWLFEVSLDESLPISRRKALLEIASHMPWRNVRECVDFWLEAREREPIASVIRLPTQITFGSSEEKQSREWHRYEEQDTSSKKAVRALLVPPPAERVVNALAFIETTNYRGFSGLCEEMTLEPDSCHYKFARFLTKTPGWRDASEETRERIVGAAKLYLQTEVELPAIVRQKELNSVYTSGMAAIWLLQEQEPSWFVDRPIEWWRLWGWYIIRELRPDWHDESNDAKLDTLRTLHTADSAAIRDAIVRFASEEFESERAGSAQSHLASLLVLIESIADEELDRLLCENIALARIPRDRLCDVSQFVLRRSPALARPPCIQKIANSMSDSNLEASVELAAALLIECPNESWREMLDCFKRRPRFGQAALERLSKGHRLRWTGISSSAFPPVSIGIPRIGELALLLFELFPPQSDPTEDETSMRRIPEGARALRNELVSWLGNQATQEAIDALRLIERSAGPMSAWLRRPRARAERAYREGLWRAIPLESVASILDAGENRLLRSEEDVADGIVAALEQYEHSLHHQSPSEIEDLWNTPRGEVPSPKAEERVSDKICSAVRAYFRQYAIVADREVQVFRRKIPKARGGLPGSEVDLLVTLPARGNSMDFPISVPIEVKRSCNAEAKTGLKDQLVDRYMSELGARVSVFAVAWLNAPGLADSHKPVWPTIDDAMRDLASMASDVLQSDGADVRTVVVDATLS